MAEKVISLLLENSIVFSVLFGGVWLIKQIFHKRMSVRLHYLIWVVVIIKLLIPFSVSMPWSPMAMLTASEPQTLLENLQTENNAADDELSVVQSTAPIIGKDSNKTEKTADPLPALIDWAAIAFCLWLAGVVVYTVWLWLKWYQLQKAIQRNGIPVPDREHNIFLSCKQAIGISKEIRLMVQDVLHVPAATGLAHPVVLVPPDFNIIQIEHVFMHELAHIKRGDIAVVWGLNILRALYWFNPLVWLCFKLVQRDMEADCDCMAVKTLGTQKLSEYIETVLYFAGKDRPASLQAAMSLNDGCTRMKQRIRSMFMNKTTKWPVKIAVVCLAAAMAFAAFTSGCGTLPVQPEQESYVSIEQWTEDDIGLENVSVKINAQVLKPDRDVFNIYETHRAGFSQQQIDKILKFVYGNKTFYSYGNGTERKSCELRLDTLQKQYDKFGLSELLEEMEWVKTYMAQWPEDADLAVSDGKMVNDRLEVWSDLGGGRQGSVSIKNSIDDTGVNPSLQIDVGNGDYYAANPPFGRQADGIALTPTQAVSKVQDMLAALGLYDIKPRDVYACNVVSDVSGEYINGLPGAYDVVCVPGVNGMDAGYVHEMKIDADEVYTGETLNVFVNDSGIVKVEWLNHWENGSVAENVSLLPFEDIKRTFKKTMAQWYQERTDGVELAVNQVVLELARVKAGDEWRLVPAWCFYSTPELLDSGDIIAGTHPGALLLAIDATDGTVIEH